MQPSTPVPPVLDLKSLAAEMKAQPSFERIEVAVRKAIHAQSCASDIEMAAGNCRALEAVKEGSGIAPEHRYAVEASLLAHAIALYTRATTSTRQQGERGGSSVSDALTDDLRMDHDAIVMLRNRVHAHVYSDEEHDKLAWHRSLLWAVETPHGWLSASAKQSVAFDKATFAKISRLLPVVSQILIERFQERLSAITNVLNAANPAPEFKPHMREAGIYFGDAQEARAILQYAAPGAKVTVLSGRALSPTPKTDPK